jgi:hypothetical protein
MPRNLVTFDAQMKTATLPACLAQEKRLAATSKRDEAPISRASMPRIAREA